VLMQTLRDADDAEPAPQATLEGARRVGHRTRKQAAPRWAAAAALVFAIFLTFNFIPDTEDGVIPAQAPTRTLLSSPLSLQVLTPEPGVVADPDELIFRWHAVDDSLHYDLRIVTASGDLVTEQRVQHTEWKLSDKLELDPGAEYFVRIDAYLPDARTVSSEHIRFRVSE